MGATKFNGYGFPEPGWEAKIAAYFMQLAAALDLDAPHPVTDKADRDTRLADLTRGIAYTTQAPWVVWLRTGTSWAELYSDTGWVTSGFSNGSGWDADSANTRVRNRNGQIEVMVEASRTGNDIVPGTAGVIDNTTVCTIPIQFAPGTRARNLLPRYGPGGMGFVTTAGEVVLSALTAGKTLANGAGVIINCSYLEG